MDEKDKYERVLMAVFELFADARKLVPEEGADFEPVWQRLNIRAFGLDLTDLVLSVRPVPKCIEGYETKRWFEIMAYNIPLERKVTRLLKSGTKAEILEYLKNKDLPTKILAALPVMDDSLNN